MRTARVISTSTILGTRFLWLSWFLNQIIITVWNFRDRSCCLCSFASFTTICFFSSPFFRNYLDLWVSRSRVSHNSMNLLNKGKITSHIILLQSFVLFKSLRGMYVPLVICKLFGLRRWAKHDIRFWSCCFKW